MSQLEGCQQLLRDGLKPLDNKLDILVNNAGKPGFSHASGKRLQLMAFEAA